MDYLDTVDDFAHLPWFHFDPKKATEVDIGVTLGYMFKMLPERFLQIMQITMLIHLVSKDLEKIYLLVGINYDKQRNIRGCYEAISY